MVRLIFRALVMFASSHRLIRQTRRSRWLECAFLPRAVLLGYKRPLRCAGSPQSGNTPPLHPSWRIPRTRLQSSRLWAAASRSCNRWGRSYSGLRMNVWAARLHSHCRSPLYEWNGTNERWMGQREKEQTVKLQHRSVYCKDVQSKFWFNWPINAYLTAIGSFFI